MEHQATASLRLGDYVLLENIPYSQKHFNDPSCTHYFRAVCGTIFALSPEKITVLNHDGEKEGFYPIPPMSGDVMVKQMERTWQKEIRVGDRIRIRNELPQSYLAEGMEYFYKYFQEMEGEVLEISWEAIRLQVSRIGTKYFYPVPPQIGTVLVEKLH